VTDSVEVIVSAQVEARDVRNCQLFSRFCGVTAVLVGSLTLLGWLLGIPALKSVLPGLATMKPNTALSFVLSGVCLWLIQQRPGEVGDAHLRSVRVARILAGIVGLAGLVTLADYLFPLDLGIGDILFHRNLLATGVLHSGRMSGATALGFLLLGASLLFMSERNPYPAQSLALLASLDGSVACAGYLVGARGLYDIPGYSSMALHTAILFAALGMAALAARPRFGVMAAITSEYTGGLMARRLLPLAIVIPTLFGWLRWRGQLRGFYGPEFGIALRTLAEAVTFATSLWLSAVWLNRLDQARRELQRRNYDLATIVASSDDAMLSLDLSSRIISWNRGAEELFGYRADEIIGQPVETIIPTELQEEAGQFLREIRMGRVVARDETVRRHKDGSHVYVSLTVSPVRDFEGRIVGSSAIAHDISDRKRGEEALRESQQRLAGVIASAMDSIITVDEKQHIVVFNAAAEKMFRCSETVALGQPIERFIPERFRPAHGGHVRQFGEKGVTNRAMGSLRALWAVRSDGEEFQIEASISQAEAGGKKLFTVILRDVTERKRAEAARERLAAVVDSSDDAIIGKDLDGTITAWNHGAERLFGYTSSEALGRPILMLLPTERASEEADILARIRRGENLEHFETVRVRKDGKRIEVSVTISPIKDVGGAIVGASKIARNITERKRAEQLLRQSERSYRTLFESMDEGFCTIEVLFGENDKPTDYRFLDVNPAFEKLTGIQNASAKRMREIAPDHEEYWFAIYGKIALTGEPARFENEAAQLGRWYEVHAFRVGEPQERKVAIFFNDITQRKLSEEALSEQAKVMESAQVLVRDMEGRIVFWPRGAEKTYGFSPREALGVVSHALFHTVFPEPLEMIDKKVLDNGVWEGELTHQTRDGRAIIVSSAWVLHRNRQGLPVRILETNIDITARKQVEQELARSRRALEIQTLMLQSVLDSMSEGLVVADEHGKFILWNPAAQKIVGLGPANIPAEEWTGHYGLFLPDRVTPFPTEQTPLARAIQGVSSSAVMFVSNPEVDEGVFVEAYASPLQDKEGGVRGGVVAFRDITERIRAEERLREYERVVESLEDMIMVLNREYRYVIANRAFLSYRAKDKEEVIGHRVDEILEKETFESVVKEKIDECFRGKVVQFELDYNYHGQVARTLYTSYFPIEGPHGIDRIACILRDISARKQSEGELRKSEERFSKAFRGSPLAITIATAAEGRYLDVNDAFITMVGQTRAEVIGQTSLDLDLWADKSQRLEMLQQLGKGGNITGFRAQHKTLTGEIRETEVSADLIELEGQTCVLAIIRDITETLKLEAQFRQAQKMEAVGRLAGGVAHDFNNMLGVIIGYCDLSLGLIAPESPANRYMEQIRKAAYRAAGLTRQLLAFSRQQVVFPKIVDLNQVVQGVTTMLQRLVGEDVAISLRPTVPIGSINADPGQVEQILMNLVVNARDAMPGGGKIIIETGHAELDEQYASQHPGAHAGQHVVLAVSDTGCGMDEKVKSQIFEPFFTTKEVGRGTGLGLSTVYGIVKQGGGTIFVYSEPGNGTTFKIYFPRVAGTAERQAQPNEEGDFPGGSETILVVEDDLPLRELTLSMLKAAGYRVIEAGNADAALDFVERFELGIDLLVTDVVMPGKSGVELVELAKAIRPSLRSLFMSGYTGDLVALRGGSMPESAFLEKPFTRSSLLKKVRSVLHSKT
jgi:PAS domain S-box-containing protein